MIPELGHFALMLALCLALVQAVLPLLGAWRGRASWMAVARPAATGQFVFIALSYAALTYAFVANDFSVLYVAQNSNSELPLVYRISAVWGSHEGSLLLWVLILAGWTLAVAAFSRSLNPLFAARVLAVMGLISIGFLAFVLFTSNPFERLVPAALEGRDLNPLLQDPGMAVHPPMLYMGYVGFAVAFAFAVAALLGGRLDAAWARWSRPWTTVAWAFLTFGITLGSWWAYNELGWGGWWFWDPVENASFMPWLVGTALMHSLAVSEKRDGFKSWTVLLAIFAFSLSLLGTFLVRSGVLNSVHAFASDPTRGLYILAFLAVVIGGSLGLYAWRAPRVRSTGHFGLLSRESLLLFNNALLVVSAASILLGTLYPLFLDALGLGKISVGPPYFDTVFVPLMLILLVLLGAGPLARWRHDTGQRLGRVLRLPAIVALAALVIAGVLLAGDHLLLAGSIGVAVWVTASTLWSLWQRVRIPGARGTSVRRPPRAFVGMTLAHLGIAVFTLGVAVSGAFSTERDVRLAPGEDYQMGPYQFVFQGVESAQGPNYSASRGTVEVRRDGRPVTVLHAEKRLYPVRGMAMTEAAVDAGVFRDLYVALGEPLGGGSWSLRLYHKPFIRWIWFGALMMMVGGLVAASDRRYRAVRVARSAEAAAARAVRAQG